MKYRFKMLFANHCDKRIVRVIGKSLLFMLVGVMLLSWVLWFRLQTTGWGMYAVIGNSMQPTIPSGAVILTQRRTVYADGDVITRRLDNGQLVTHRILNGIEDGGEVEYRLKGDGNQTADAELVNAQEIVGRVSYMVPWLGYAVMFSKTKLGIGLLIVLPAIILMLKATGDILGEIDRQMRDKSAVRSKV